MSTPLRFDPELACANCGGFGAYAFEDRPLCLACYQEHGSCCAEREMSDDDSPPEPPPPDSPPASR